MKKYQHIFWDLDHTLWDFDANSENTLKVVYDTFGLFDLGIIEFPKFSKLYEVLNEQLWVQLRAGTISRELLRWKRMDMALQHFGINNEPLAHQMSTLYLEILPQQKQLLPGALDVLEYCKSQDYHLHIITNGFETTQMQKLANSGIGTYFQHIFTSENANAMKPHPPIFHYALDKSSAQLTNSIMIGDSLEADVIGAKQMGMDQIFYNPHAIQHQEEVTFEVADLRDIIKIL